MAPKEPDHPLQLIVALSRVGEKGVVATSFVVMRLDRFLVSSQRRFELTCQRYVRVCASATRGAIRCSMQDENRHIEIRGAGHRPSRMACVMKNDGLHVPYGQYVLQAFGAAP